MNSEEQYINRCFALARKAGRNVRSNPLVGAVIVCGDTIIGEGYHEKLGENHAEVNALLSVLRKDESKVKDSTLYVSLEPCNHFGRTPPCTNVIIESGIKKVVISALDPNPRMQGKSINLLRNAGIDVKSEVLPDHGNYLIRRFKANLNGLPFVTLKMAKSKDGFIGKKESRILVSGKESVVLSHKLRAEHDGILIGTNTAIIDDPQLTTREYPGDNPLRIVVDRNQNIPSTRKVVSDQFETIILSSNENYKVNADSKRVVLLEKWNLPNILSKLYELEVFSLLVEGGAKLLDSFIKQALWDEAYIISSEKKLDEGVKAPGIRGKISKKFEIGRDTVYHIYR